MRRLACGCLLTTIALLSAAGAASAGTYTDWECQGPGGAAVPAKGFAGDQSPKAEAVNTCGTLDGGLGVGLTGTPAWQAGLGAFFRYEAPDNTSIAAVEIGRRTTGAPVGLSNLGYQIRVDGVTLDGCLPGAGCSGDRDGVVVGNALDAGELVLSAGCGGLAPDECATPIRLDVPRAKITLRDDRAPTIANVQGSLVTPGAKSGTATVEFDAADDGGGLYRMVTSIDGNPFEVQPAALGTCTDIDPGNAAPYEFAAKVPCPLSQAGLSVAVDTTRLTDGDHTIDVVLEDAAGNRVTVVGPAARLTVDNAPQRAATPVAVPVPVVTERERRAEAVPGRLKLWFAATRTRSYTTRVGQRVVVRGFLRDLRGRGIRGAQVEVYHFVRGRPRLLKTGLRSRKYGRLTLILPLNLFGDARGRRRIAFYYRALRPGPVTARQNLYLTILSRHGRPQTTPPDRAG